MFAVVKTDAKNGRWLNRGKDLAESDGFVGDVKFTEEITGDALCCSVVLNSGIFDGVRVGAVPDDTHGGEVYFFCWMMSGLFSGGVTTVDRHRAAGHK